MEDFSEYLDENESNIIKKYESLVLNNNDFYMDEDDYQIVIDHYLSYLDFSKANQAISIAERTFPESIEIQFRKGKKLFFENSYDNALKILRKIIALDPANTEFLFFKARIYSSLNKHVKAIETYQLILSINDDFEENFIYYLISEEFEKLNKFDLAFEYKKKAALANTEDLFVLTELFVDTKEDSKNETLAFLNNLIEEDPYNYNVWFTLGCFHTKFNDTNKAIDAYDYVIAINKKMISAYYNKANIYFNKGDFYEAIKIYDEILEHDDNQAHVFYMMAITYDNLCDFANAVKYYKKVLEIDEFYSEAWYNIALIFYEEEKLQKSLKYVDNAINIDDDDFRYYHLKGKILFELDNYKEAEENYIRCMVPEYDSSQLLVDYAELISYSESIEKSVEILRDAVENNPTNSQLNLYLSGYLFKLGKRKEAKTFFEDSVICDTAFLEDFFIDFPELKEDKSIVKILNKYKSNEL